MGRRSGTGNVPLAPRASNPPHSSVQQREERLAERLLDDEALRGSLDDATFQPIQDWLLVEAARLAASTDGLDDATAAPLLDRGLRTLREAARTRVAALEGTGT